MTPDEYMVQRVDEQYQWLSDKSSRNQRWFRRLRLAEICLAGSVPVLAAYAKVSFTAQLSVAIAGALAAIVAGSTGLWKHQELWTEYRATAEALKREKLLYLTRTPPYDGDDAFAEFVSQIENILGAENSKWSERMRKDRHKRLASGTDDWPSLNTRRDRPVRELLPGGEGSTPKV